MYCKQCGKELDNDTKFCPECGVKVDRKNQDIQKKIKPSIKIWIIAMAVVGSLIAGAVIISAIFDLQKTEEKSKVEVQQWSSKDLSFYDQDGEEKLNCTDALEVLDVHDMVVISKEENVGLQTYRGVKVGDNAKRALKKYNVADMVCDFSLPYDDEEGRKEALKEKIRLWDKYNKDLTAVDVLEQMSDIAKDDMTIHFETFLEEYEEGISAVRINIEEGTSTEDKVKKGKRLHAYNVRFSVRKGRIVSVAIQKLPVF